jgi:tetrahydrodipicolinate N-succinyltransferase
MGIVVGIGVGPTLGVGVVVGAGVSVATGVGVAASPGVAAGVGVTAATGVGLGVAGVVFEQAPTTVAMARTATAVPSPDKRRVLIDPSLRPNRSGGSSSPRTWTL